MIIERVKSDAPLTQEFRHLKTLWGVWADLLRGGSNLLIQFNLNMFYNVNNERGVASVSGEGSLIWPRIASSHTMSFPLILIGNHTVSQYIIGILLVYYWDIIWILLVYCWCHVLFIIVFRNSSSQFGIHPLTLSMFSPSSSRIILTPPLNSSHFYRRYTT